MENSLQIAEYIKQLTFVLRAQNVSDTTSANLKVAYVAVCVEFPGVIDRPNETAEGALSSFKSILHWTIEEMAKRNLALPKPIFQRQPISEDATIGIKLDEQTESLVTRLCRINGLPSLVDLVILSSNLLRVPQINLSDIL